MQSVPDTGTFTRRNQSIINSNFGQLTNPDFWVRPQGPGAKNTNPGTYESPFADMNGVSQYLKPGVVVGLEGVLFQTAAFAPGPVNDVTIIGMANTPRQATSSGIPNGGGATWMNTVAGTYSIVQVGGPSTAVLPSQGWRFENIFFSNAATNATTACVELLRGDGAGAGERDASHASFVNCKFTGGNYGILDSGGCGFVTIDGCEFFNFAGSGDTAIKEGTATGVALPLQWTIRNSNFWNNVNHIQIPLSSAAIYNNNFGWIGSTITTTIIYDATNGKNNAIWNNKVGVASDAAGITAAVVLGTNDSYGPQFYTDKEEYGDPAS